MILSFRARKRDFPESFGGKTLILSTTRRLKTLTENDWRKTDLGNQSKLWVQNEAKRAGFQSEGAWMCRKQVLLRRKGFRNGLGERKSRFERNNPNSAGWVALKNSEIATFLSVAVKSIASIASISYVIHSRSHARQRQDCGFQKADAHLLLSLFR
jgi:hypothetical protein